MLLVCRLAAAEVEKKGDRLVWAQHPQAHVTAQKHKMSKSRGNVINPDDVVYQYGADSLRLYEMFLGPLTDTKVRPYCHHARGIAAYCRCLSYLLSVNHHT